MLYLDFKFMDRDNFSFCFACHDTADSVTEMLVSGCCNELSAAILLWADRRSEKCHCCSV